MEDKILIAMVSGLIGGIVGLVGAAISSYYGPLKLEERRERLRAEKWDKPRKRLLSNMLNDPKKPMRSIETLCRASGTTPEECQRLLIEIEARGIRLSGNRDGWVLIRNKPLEQMDDEED